MAIELEYGNSQAYKDIGAKSDFNFIHEDGVGSVTFWMKLSTIAGFGTEPGIWTNNSESATNLGFHFTAIEGAGSGAGFKLDVGDGSLNQWAVNFSISATPDTDWHFYAITLDRGVPEEFLSRDGGAHTQTKTTAAGTFGSGDSQNTNWLGDFGGLGGRTSQFEHVEWWDRVLSVDEINSIYFSRGNHKITRGRITAQTFNNEESGATLSGSLDRDIDKNDLGGTIVGAGTINTTTAPVNKGI